MTPTTTCPCNALFKPYEHTGSSGIWYCAEMKHIAITDPAFTGYSLYKFMYYVDAEGKEFTVDKL